uniref:Uncharacterized protein n=1 Tax=Anguilla anguilla TaxID=7936 RepID=A0A0E9WMX0_ANGAN
MLPLKQNKLYPGDSAIVQHGQTKVNKNKNRVPGKMS